MYVHVSWIPFWQDQRHERSDGIVIMGVPSNNSGENMADMTVVMEVLETSAKFRCGTLI